MHGSVRRLPFLRIAYLGLTVFLGTSQIGAGQSVTFSVGSASGIAGDVVVIPITLTSSGGAPAAAIQWTLNHPSDITRATITASLNGQDRSTTINLRSRPVPTADSVSPSASLGSRQTFTFVFSDSQSSSNLAAAAMLFAPASVAQNSCYVIYDRNRGTIQLQWDDVKGNQNQPVGSSKILENSQCVIGATSVRTTAFSTSVTLDVTFKSAFADPKNIYMYGADGDGSINTGWVLKGTWTPTP